MRIIPWLLAAVFLAGCNLVYKQDIQQGNVLADEDVAKLDIGMTKRQVLVLLGSPAIQSPFHDDRWDYTNTYSRRGRRPASRVLTLYFENNRLASIEGSYLDQDSAAARALRELQQPPEDPIGDMQSISDGP